MLLQKQMLDAESRLLGKDHSDTLNAKENLATTYWRDSRWEEARNLQEETLEEKRKVLGHNHPDMLKAINNLGHWEESETYLEIVHSTNKYLEVSLPSP